MATPPLIALRDARVTFGGRPTFEGISLALAKGDRACLVGRNGSGKSTLMKVLAGLAELDAGERFLHPAARVAYMPQEPSFAGAADAFAYVAGGLPPTTDDSPRGFLVEAALAEAEISPSRALDGLSGGEARRLSLARALVGEPDILLLDEPTNHLDILSIEGLEARLTDFAGALLLISHDRAFLARLSRRTLWLDRGRLLALEEGYAGFEAWSAGVLEAEAAERARLEKRIATETVWLRQGISARRTRNEGRVRRLAAMREERANEIKLRNAVLGGPPAASAGGRLVAELKGVAKAWEGKPVVAQFSTRLLRGDRVGIVGRNGAGKSTLIGLLLGTIAPDAGEVRHGTGLLPAVFDQRRAALDMDATPWETLAGEGDTVFVQGCPRHVASYLGDFLFDERQLRAKVASLSGGERNRLLLAKVLAQPSNLLVLDEPTNDLDMETLDLLEDLLADYDGTLLLVSHDRDFLDRLVASVIAVEGGGTVHEYVGGWTDYVRQRRRPESEAAPSRRAPAAKSAPPPPPPPRRERLSWAERKDLDALPGRIASLEAETARLQGRLADPALFARDRKAFEAATARLAAAAAELAEAEDRWLALEEKAERERAGP